MVPAQTSACARSVIPSEVEESRGITQNLAALPKRTATGFLAYARNDGVSAPDSAEDPIYFRLFDFEKPPLLPDDSEPDFLLLDFDFPPPDLLAADFDFAPPVRVGSFFRFALASRSSSFSLMEAAMLFDAPRSDDFDLSPRLAASAAPAAICCFLDFAGITPLRSRPAARLASR